MSVGINLIVYCRLQRRSPSIKLMPIIGQYTEYLWECKSDFAQYRDVGPVCKIVHDHSARLLELIRKERSGIARGRVGDELIKGDYEVARETIENAIRGEQYEESRNLENEHMEVRYQHLQQNWESYTQSADPELENLIKTDLQEYKDEALRSLDQIREHIALDVEACDLDRELFQTLVAEMKEHMEKLMLLFLQCI